MRYCWTSLPTGKPIRNRTNLPLTWQECLLVGSRVPLDTSRMPALKCPTLMAASRSHSDKSRASWLYDASDTLRPLHKNEKERLVGMEINDTCTNPHVSYI